MGSYEPFSGQTGDQFISTLGSMLSGEGGKRGEGSATGGEGNAPEASGSGGQIGGCKNLGWELIGEISGVKGLAKVWSVPWKLPQITSIPDIPFGLYECLGFSGGGPCIESDHIRRCRVCRVDLTQLPGLVLGLLSLVTACVCIGTCDGS